MGYTELMLDLAENINRLRAEGKTYNQIKNALGCSKATISYHCNPKAKEYYKKKRNSNRKKQRLLIKKEAGGCCSICGYNKCPAALHFHHLQDKTQGVSIVLKAKGILAAREESRKCVLLCANCHAEVHYLT
jgi:hypothetical protein